MAIEEILRTIGGFHPCDDRAATHEPVSEAHGNVPKYPFASGMLWYTSPRGDFALKVLEHATFVMSGDRYWVCYKKIPFAVLDSLDCTVAEHAQRRA